MNVLDILINNYKENKRFLDDYLDSKIKMNLEKIKECDRVKNFNKFKKDIYMCQEIKFELQKIVVLLKEVNKKDE